MFKNIKVFNAKKLFTTKKKIFFFDYIFQRVLKIFYSIMTIKSIWVNELNVYVILYFFLKLEKLIFKLFKKLLSLINVK